MMGEVVYIVDDDAAIRESLLVLIESAGWTGRAFASGEEFLAACEPDWRGCVLLDVRMPGPSGLVVQAELARRSIHLPIVFLTGHADVAMAVRALKGGAVDFLEKPVKGDVLLGRLAAVLALQATPATSGGEEPSARVRYQRLTERERQIMALVVAGKGNKDIARALRISHRTVEIHRSRVMRKMEAPSVMALAAIAPLCREE
jgi:FixJ family two-component response regulator